MKKIFIIAITIGFLSCIKKHNYECICDVGYERITSEIHRKTEDDAKNICKESGADYYKTGPTSAPLNTVDCHVERQK